MRPFLPSLALLALPALSACVASGDPYPSLAPRPIETLATAPESEVVAPPAPTDPALESQVSTLAGRLDAAMRAFDAEAATAEPILRRAAGAAVGSEAWLSGQQSVAVLDSARAPIVEVLGELDELRLTALQDGKDMTSLEAVHARATAAEAASRTRYTGLAEALSPA